MNTAAEFNKVRFCYENVCAVENVTFSISPNELTVLIGPNGGGKSTLVKLLAGLIKPNAGIIKISENMTIGYVAQEYNFDKSFPITVKEMVLCGTMDDTIHPFFKYTKLHKDAAQKAIETVGLTGLENRGISQLSGGQLKRAMIARAIATDVDIIVLDEPGSHLDTEALQDLYSLLKKFKSTKSVVVVSHNIDSILDIADNAVYVNKTTRYFNDPEELRVKLKRGLII